MLTNETHNATSKKLSELLQAFQVLGLRVNNAALEAGYVNSNASELNDAVTSAYQQVTAMQPLPHNPAFLQQTAGDLLVEANKLTQLVSQYSFL